MRVLLRVLVLCLPLLTIPAIPVHAAASAPLIFPPASAFLLPSDETGGTLQVYSGKAVNSPLQYFSYERGDGINLPFFGYSVFLYKTAVAAGQDNTSDKSLRSGQGYTVVVHHPIVTSEWVAILPTFPLDKGRYSTTVYAGFAFRNLYISLEISEYKPSSAVATASLDNRLATMAIAVIQSLATRAQAFAAHPFNVPPTTPSIFPSASVFVLPSSTVGGTIKVVSQSLNGWPVRPPITATLYEVTNTDFAYEVDVFHSSVEAKNYNDLPFTSGYTVYNVPQPVTLDEHLIGSEDTKHGYYYAQASVAFHNLYLTGDANVFYSDHPSLPKAGVQALAKQEALAIFAKIYGRAMSFATHPNLYAASPTAVAASPTTGIEPHRLLYPTPAIFARDPYQVTVGDPQSLPFKNALADYSYQQDPHGIDYDSYEAITFNSVAAAHKYNDATYGAQDNTIGANPWQSIPVPSPLTPNEHAWVEGDGSPGATCTLVLTLAYGNLVLDSTVADQCAGDSGSPALSPDKVQHATDLLSFLLAHAENYATGAPVSLNVQRNRAFVSLVHDLNGRISRCQSAFAPAYQEFQHLAALMSIGKGNPQHVISLVTLVGQACDAYPFFDSPGMGLPGYTLDQTLVHEASVRHLVYTDVHNALSARDDAALAINRYAQGFERGQAADVLVQYYTAAVKAAQMGLVYDKQVKQDMATIANTWHVNL